MYEKKNKLKYLFISDLDGTLLNKNHGLEKEVAQRLNNMIKEGLKFTYITSRDWKSSRCIMKNVEIPLPVAICGGAAIIDYRTGRILKEWNIHPSVIRNVITILKQFDIEMSLVTDKEGVVNNYVITSSDELSKIKKLESEKIISIAFKDSPEKVSCIHESINDLNAKLIKTAVFQDADNASRTILEIVTASVSKGIAAKEIVNMCQELKEQKVIAFGNDTNDLNLLKYAKIGVGVGDIPQELEKYANVHLKYTQGLSVLQFIEKYFYQI